MNRQQINHELDNSYTSGIIDGMMQFKEQLDNGAAEEHIINSIPMMIKLFNETLGARVHASVIADFIDKHASESLREEFFSLRHAQRG